MVYTTIFRAFLLFAISCCCIMTTVQAQFWSSQVTQPDTVFDPGFPGVNAAPSVAIDQNGNAIAIWQSSPNQIFSSATIQSATLPFGSANWSAPLTLAPMDSGANLPDNPHIGVDDAGNAVAILTVGNTSLLSTVYAATLPFGAMSWSALTQISAAGSITPQLAVAGNGNAVAIWSTTSGIQAASYDGTTWSGAVTIPGSSTSGVNPQIGVDGSGNAVAVWATPSGIEYATYTFGGSWSTAALIPGSIASAENPQVSVNVSGNAVAVWDQTNAGHTIVQAATRPSGGSWSSLTALSAAGENATHAQVKMDPTGNAVAVWVGTGGGFGAPSIEGASYVSGAWQTTVIIEVATPTVTNLTAPQIAVDAAGDAIVVYVQTLAAVGSPTNIEAATLAFGGSWVTWGAISNDSKNVAPQIASAPTGYGVAVWNDISVTLDNVVQSSQYTLAPTVLNVAPNSGSPAGGNSVTITGMNFQNASAVTFGSTAAVSFTIVSDTEITATVPAGSGTVDVTVTTPAGTSAISPGDQYSYTSTPSTPNKPRKFHGKLTKTHHTRHNKNFKLNTTWKAPKPATNVTSYNIYQDGKAKYSIQATSKHKFKKHVRSSHHLHHRYKITAVNSTGGESSKKKLKIVKR